MSHDYNFAGTFITNLKLFPNFIKTWFLYMYLNKYILWIIIIVLGIISYYIYKKQQNINENKKYTNLMIIITSILAGYQLTCLGEIFGYQILPEYDYSFMREFDNCFYVHLLEIIILMLISYIYYNLSNKIKTIIINILITAVIVFFSIKLYNAYGQLIKYKIQGRINAYTTEKINLVYALLGESPIFCSEINEDSKFLGSGIFGFGVHIDGYKYINPVLTKYYKYYFKLAYGYDYNAYIFLTKDIMIKELNKRLLLFDDKLESKEQLIKEGIKFEKLSKKYGNKNLTLSDIDKIEKKHGKSDILTKARAYVYFKNSNYDDALKLYNEYLEKNPEDFDALINTAYMYENLYRNYKKAEEIYLKLDKMDPQNISFKYNYMRLLYEYDKNYTEALKVCDEIINSDFPILTTIYYNKGLIYQALNDKEKANEYFEKSKNEENRNKYKLLYSTIFVEELLPAFDT